MYSRNYMLLRCDVHLHILVAYQVHTSTQIAQSFIGTFISNGVICCPTNSATLQAENETLKPWSWLRYLKHFQAPFWWSINFWCKWSTSGGHLRWHARYVKTTIKTSGYGNKKTDNEIMMASSFIKLKNIQNDASLETALLVGRRREETSKPHRRPSCDIIHVVQCLCNGDTESSSPNNEILFLPTTMIWTGIPIRYRCPPYLIDMHDYSAPTPWTTVMNSDELLRCSLLFDSLTIATDTCVFAFFEP